jgi:hypothetical protein
VTFKRFLGGNTMIRNNISRVSLIALALSLGSGTVALAADQSAPASPQALTNPSISRWVIASGGGVASNGGYQLRGAIGQPLAGTSTGGSYSLKSGYHSEDDLIFRNDLDQ